MFKVRVLGDVVSHVDLFAAPVILEIASLAAGVRGQRSEVSMAHGTRRLARETRRRVRFRPLTYRGGTIGEEDVKYAHVTYLTLPQE
jgi:hypothetical protein